MKPAMHWHRDQAASGWRSRAWVTVLGATVPATRFELQVYDEGDWAIYRNGVHWRTGGSRERGEPSPGRLLQSKREALHAAGLLKGERTR